MLQLTIYLFLCIFVCEEIEHNDKLGFYTGKLFWTEVEPWSQNQKVENKKQGRQTF